MKPKKLFVGNCAYTIDENTLKEFFESNGVKTTSVQIIRDRYTDRSKGFGFVELEESEDVDKVIEALNGKELAERALTINVAKERSSRSPRMQFDSPPDSRGGGGKGKRKGRW